MTAAAPHDDRDVVPRWRPFGSTVRRGETTPLDVREPLAAHADLSEVETAFSDWPGPHSAADLVGSALASRSRSKPAVAAARYLVSAPAASKSARDLAGVYLAYVTDGQPVVTDDDKPELDLDAIKRRVGELRRIVRAEPRNAIRWTNLALAHTVLGHTQLAEREIRTALALGASNRFVLRAAASLYVHLDRPDDAHAILVRDPSLLADPWLLSAELATAELAELTSRHMKHARALVAEGPSMGPWHVSELASQVATTDLRAGRLKQARRLMQLALIQPNENAVAQAEWASTNGLALDPVSLDMPRTYEARALRHSHEGEWGLATQAGLDWLADQPFAVDAATFTSYAASIGAEDFRAAEYAARIGLVANPDEHLLRNNLAFALALQGRASEAAGELEHVPFHAMSGRDRATVRATRGLIQYRLGNVIAGRALYVDAIAELKREQAQDLASLAMSLWAREELSAKTAEARTILEAAAAAVAAAGSPEARLCIERLAATTEHSIHLPAAVQRGS